MSLLIIELYYSRARDCCSLRSPCGKFCANLEGAAIQQSVRRRPVDPDSPGVKRDCGRDGMGGRHVLSLSGSSSFLYHVENYGIYDTEVHSFGK